MKTRYVTLLLLLIFILEGTWMNWLIPGSWQGEVVVSPRLVLVLIIFIGIYRDRHIALLFGMAFGLLHDIVYYGPMIGTYCLAMGTVGYVAGLFRFRPQGNILTSLFVVTVGLFLFEWMIYGIYRLLEVTHASPEWVFLKQILPGILINLLVALAAYVPIRRLLERGRTTRAMD